MQELNDYTPPATTVEEAGNEPVEITDFGDSFYLKQKGEDGVVYDIIMTLPQALNVAQAILQLIERRLPEPTVNVEKPALVLTDASGNVVG